MSYPVDAAMLAEFSKRCGTMVVIEERRSFLEQNLRDALFQLLEPRLVELARLSLERGFGRNSGSQGFSSCQPERN